MRSRFLAVPTALGVLLLGGVVGGIAACSDSSTEPLVPSELELDQTELSLTVQETATLAVRFLDQDGAVMSQVPEGYEITWTTSDSRVLEVDGGTVTATGTGIGVVSARAADLPVAQVTVTVAPRELSAELSFDYQNASSGTFEVASTFLMHFDQTPFDWAATFYQTELAGQDIVAERIGDGGLISFIVMWMDRDGPIETAGTYDLDGALVVFGFGGNGPPQEAYDEFVGGTVTFTSVAGGRAQGTFEVELTDGDEATLEVAEGSFDIPIVSETELGIGAPPMAAPGVRVGPEAPAVRR